jgi:hypothetical protein
MLRQHRNSCWPVSLPVQQRCMACCT